MPLTLELARYALQLLLFGLVLLNLFFFVAIAMALAGALEAAAWAFVLPGRLLGALTRRGLPRGKR